MKRKYELTVIVDVDADTKQGFRAAMKDARETLSDSSATADYFYQILVGGRKIKQLLKLK